MKSSLSFVALLFLSTNTFAESATVTEKEYGEEWPFTVSEGLLKCSDKGVTFVSGGVVYAVNGTATSHGFADIEPIWKYDEAMLSELAKAYNTTLEEMKKTSPMRISIGPIIKDGLKLCGN